MATLVHRETDAAALASPNTAKVEVDSDGFAVVFTRADISRDPSRGPVFRHVGVYGFRRDTLLAFASWPPSPLEQAERLEQLRALEHGVRIRVFESLAPSSGVDTPEQLAALEARGPRS
jgi:3-deoxy-manno-octulosonate cytidylyltransferase (CMP-KDO synthetase)